MKKTYKNPVLEVIKIQTQQMLALSAGYDATEINDPADVDGRFTEEDF